MQPLWYSGTLDEVRDCFKTWERKLREQDEEIKFMIQRIKERRCIPLAGKLDSLS